MLTEVDTECLIRLFRLSIGALSSILEFLNSANLEGIHFSSYRFCFVGRNYSRELQSLIHWMLEKKPAMRPSMNDILSHPSISARIQIYQMKEEHR